jgi:hypothetical protein
LRAIVISAAYALIATLITIEAVLGIGLDSFVCAVDTGTVRVVACEYESRFDASFAFEEDPVGRRAEEDLFETVHRVAADLEPETRRYGVVEDVRVDGGVNRVAFTTTSHRRLESGKAIKDRITEIGVIGLYGVRVEREVFSWDFGFLLSEPVIYPRERQVGCLHGYK